MLRAMAGGVKYRLDCLLIILGGDSYVSAIVLEDHRGVVGELEFQVSWRLKFAE